MNVVLQGALTRHAEERIRLGGHADAQEGRLRLVVDLGLPVINIVLFWDGQVAHDGALGVEELDFSTGFDETISDFELGLELPGRNALFLDGKVLR